MLRYEIPGDVPTDLLPESGERTFGQNYVAINGETPEHHHQAITAAANAGLRVRELADNAHVVSV